MGAPQPCRARSRVAVLAAVAVAVAVAACGSGSATPAASGTPTGSAGGITATIRVGAAPSLAVAFGEMTAPFEAANPGLHLVVTAGPSQTLVTQVQAGGFDAFAADDLAVAQTVVSNRHAAGPAQVFATDPLVLIVPGANPARIASAADLARPGVRIAAPVAAAPLATATTAEIAALAGQPGFGAGYDAAVVANTTAAGDDPRDPLTKIQKGDADAAFVYATDALGVAGTSAIALPTAGLVTPKFAVVVLATSTNPEAAGAFARWLTTSGGQAILTKYGFGLPAGS